MRKIIYPFILLPALFALPGHSQDVLAIPGKIQRSLMEGMQPAKNDCCSLPPSLARCLDSICNEPTERSGYDRLRNKLDFIVYERFREDAAHLKPMLRKWLDALISSESQEMTKLAQAMGSKTTALDPESGRLSNIYFLSAYADETVFSDDSTETNLVLDVDKMRPRLSHLPPADQKWLFSALKAYYAHPAIQERERVAYGQTSTQAYRLRFPDLSLQEAIKRDARLTQERLKIIYEKTLKHLKVPEAIMANWIPKHLLQSIEENAQLSPASLEEFFLAARYIEFWADVLQNGKYHPWLSTRPSSATSILGKTNVVRANIGKANSFFGNAEKLRKLRLKMMSECTIAFSENLTALPTKAQIASMKPLIDEAKNAIIERVASRFSLSTRQMLAATIKTTEVTLPRSKADFERSFTEALKRSSEEANMIANWAQAPDTAAAQTQSALALISELSTKDYDPERSFLQNFQICQDFRLQPSGAHAVLDFDRVLMTWQVFVNQANMRPSLFHELGHIMEHALKSDRASAESQLHFKNVMECLKQKHPKDGKDFLSEDFADLVSARASNKPQNGACRFMPEYSEQKRKASLTQTEVAEDTHSPFAFRILHTEHVLNGKLPEACSPFALTPNGKELFSDCL